MTESIPEDTRDIDHLVETPDSLRDDDPEVPPMDRGNEATDRPLGAEKHGTTHSEADAGESLDQKLAEEEPEVDSHDPVDDIVADDPATFGPDVGESDDEVLADAYGGPDAGDDLSAAEAAAEFEREQR